MLKTLIPLVLLLSACGGSTLPVGDPEVSGAWIRSAPPSAEVLAGYMTLSNLSAEDIKVVAATSPAFETVEFHQMEMNNGQMLMQKMEGIQAPSGQRAKLQPGSDHLMLIGPIKPLLAGEEVSVTFTLESAKGSSELAVTFRVRDRAPGS